ncbi:AbrB/MazE/SpoVT family DNA-binding domain-containing protein [bacterium]|nr:AbrB/MazE/SpoVT family DNA-binding domain-containing protein [bacterium]
MKSRIVKIGNSQGIRIPKPLIEQTGLGEEVEIQVEKNRLIIGPAARPREGWDAAFQKMENAGDDAMLDGDVHVPTSWEGTEWEW